MRQRLAIGGAIIVVVVVAVVAWPGGGEPVPTEPVDRRAAMTAAEAVPVATQREPVVVQDIEPEHPAVTVPFLVKDMRYGRVEDFAPELAAQVQKDLRRSQAYLGTHRIDAVTPLRFGGCTILATLLQDVPERSLRAGSQLETSSVLDCTGWRPGEIRTFAIVFAGHSFVVAHASAPWKH